MIAGQLTRAEIVEIAVSRWWSSPTLLDPHGLLLLVPRRIVFLPFLLRRSQEARRGPVSIPVLVPAGGPLWEKGAARQEEKGLPKTRARISHCRRKPAGDSS